MAAVQAAAIGQGVVAADRDDPPVGVANVHLGLAVDVRPVEERQRAGEPDPRRGDLGGHRLRRGAALDGGHGRGGTPLGRVAHAQLEREVAGDFLRDRGERPVADRAAHEVLGAKRLRPGERAFAHAVLGATAGFRAPVGEPCARIVEPAIAPRHESLCLEVARLVLHLEARGVALDGFRPVLGASELADHEGALAHLRHGVGAGELEGRLRIVVLHERAPDLDRVGHLHLRVHARDPELVAALVDFVGDADEDRVQVAIHARHRAAEEDAAGERLDLVVAEARLRQARDHERGLVAVARDDLDLLAVDERPARAELVGPRGAVGAQLLDHLPRRVARGEDVGAHAVVLEVVLHAGERAAVVRQAPHVALALRREIAPQQVRPVPVDAHVQAAGRLRVVAAHRGIAVHRVELVGLDVAEEALARVLVRVVGRGEQEVALDLALEEEGRAGARAALAVVPVAGQVPQLLLEAVGLARRDEGARVDVAHVHRPLDHSGGDERAKLRQEVQARLGPQRPARHHDLGGGRLHGRG